MLLKKRIAIIGAGASGLTAAKQALDYDLEPVVFEKSLNIGGLWHYKPYETDESSVMKSTVINTSKEMTAFSDYPPPAHVANFMHNRKMLEYLKSYAEHFCVVKHILFNTEIKNIERSSDYNKTGKWIVYYQILTNDSKIVSEEFDAVLLCSGHHATPLFPEKWPNQEKFLGKITHAHSYKDSRGFEDKNILVVGVGNSGVDIAVELSRVCNQVYLITRRGTWVLNRNLNYSEPFDLVLNRRFLNYLLSIFPYTFSSAIMTQGLKKRLNYKKFGLEPKHHLFAAHWTVNDELPNRLSCGTIIIKQNIKYFTETGVIFEDGSEVKNVDQVILCTGYLFNFQIIENGNLIPVENNEVKLYKYVFPPETSDHNTLGIIGLIQPLGSIMPISEMQTRVFFEVFVKNTTLPNRIKMNLDINNKKKKLLMRYVNSSRHTIQVDYVEYMEELASIIKVSPSALNLIFTDFWLAIQITFGPTYPYIYRLCGPKSWPEARKAIFSANIRKDCGMSAKNELLEKKNTKKNFFSCNTSIFNVFFVIFVSFFFFFIIKNL